MEILNWFPFLYIMELTENRIENDKNLLLSLLKGITMFKNKFWWNPRGDYLKQTVEKVAIRYSNCVKETMIYVDILDTTYQELITTFVMKKMLHHAGMLWIIENHE